MLRWERTVIHLILIALLSGGCGSTSEADNSTAAVTAPIPNEPFRLFLRVFKQEDVIEAWVKPATAEQYHLLREYPVCRKSGAPGPKRREGDLQVPEGVYHIDRFNPNSLYHLSLGLNYPNASDRLRGDPSAPGSDIFIHGDCVTVGCLPITDPLIEDLYTLAETAKGYGHPIAVHIFPFRLDDRYTDRLRTGAAHRSFWAELYPVYRFFETTRNLPVVTISPTGAYLAN